MTDLQTAAWIFLSTAMAAGTKGTFASEEKIASAADYINHAIPTANELKLGFENLVELKLVVHSKEGYALTAAGKKLALKVEKRTKQVLKQWPLVEAELVLLMK